MKKKKSGFTLIEMIIVLMLTVIIASVMNTIFLTGNKVFSNSDVKSDLQIEGQTTQETLSNLAMQGTGIKSVDGVDFESDLDSVKAKKTNMMDKWNKISQNLVLIVAEKKPDPKDSNKEIIVRQDYTFVLDGKNLLMKKSDSDPGKTLSRNVNTFNIKPSNTGVEIEVELKERKGFAEKVYPIKLDALFRNKDVTFDKDVTSDTFGS